jgi:hypothetical protein
VPESTPWRLVQEEGAAAASALVVLTHFGYIIENMNGSKVHSLYNVMTLEINVLDRFGRLQVWFEKTVSVAFISFALSN